MNGFMLLSQESGFLLCTKSYVGADLGLGPLGSNPLQLSSTLFTFCRMGREAEALRIREHCNLQTTPNSALSDPDARRGRLRWLKLGETFLHFHDIYASSSITGEASEENADADSLHGAPNPSEAGACSGHSAIASDGRTGVIVVLVSAAGRAAASTGESETLEPFIASVLRKFQERGATYLRGRTADTTMSSRELCAWADAIVQEEQLKHKQLLSMFQGAELNNTSIAALREEFQGNLNSRDAEDWGSQSWLETLSQIPSRIIRALSKRKRESSL